MKKFILPIMLISGMATFNACGTTSGSTYASNGSLLGDAIAGAVAQNGNNDIKARRIELVFLNECVPLGDLLGIRRKLL